MSVACSDACSFRRCVVFYVIIWIFGGPVYGMILTFWDFARLTCPGCVLRDGPGVVSSYRLFLEVDVLGVVPCSTSLGWQHQ